MKALISTIENKYTGYRIAQVVTDENEFPVANDLFWINCADTVNANEYWYDPADQQIKLNSLMEDANLIASKNRQIAYIAEADALFFKAQRGEATMEEWKAKVAEIKARFPKGS
jgi:hypothetical protein